MGALLFEIAELPDVGRLLTYFELTHPAVEMCFAPRREQRNSRRELTEALERTGTSEVPRYVQFAGHLEFQATLVNATRICGEIRQSQSR
jgi:hypothetical protein